MDAGSGTWIATNALVDSGASLSLFDGSIGRDLGLTIRRGRRIEPSGIGGSIVAYVHSVTLRIGDDELHGEVAFAYKRKLPVNLLGRASIFERFRVTFEEATRKVILETM